MHRILLVEDNRLNQVVAAGALKKLGYEVDIADDGEAALRACADTRYAAVLMDVMMPTMDGYRAVSLLRQREQAEGVAQVPVIGLSARALPGDREVALDAGMNDYLTKPLRAAGLGDALSRWVCDADPAREPAL